MALFRPKPNLNKRPGNFVEQLTNDIELSAFETRRFWLTGSHPKHQKPERHRRRDNGLRNTSPGEYYIQGKKWIAKKNTYNTRDSPVVTDPSTSLALTCLSMGERTGSRVFKWIWSYVVKQRPSVCLYSSSTS